MTFRQWFLAGIVVSAAALGLNACAKHENPLQPQDTTTRQAARQTFGFNQQLSRNDLNDPISRQVVVVYASDEDLTAYQQPFPVLYLLHDYGAGADFFERYGLQSLVDDMYRKGEIGRMLIVTVDASNGFGGSYYRNTISIGRYEDLLTALISETESTYKIYTAAGSAARAIGGYGMGGYGAMRYAVEHPELFSSVSAMSAPLAFGDLQRVQRDLVSFVFAENDVQPGDPTLYGKLRSGWEKPGRPWTREFFAMSAAFSPHSMRRFDSIGHYIYQNPLRPAVKDTIYPWEFYSTRPPGPRTIRFLGADTSGVGVDMIFDSLGNFRDDSTWAFWRDSSDVKTMFERKRQANPSVFSGLDSAIWIDVGKDDDAWYRDQSAAFSQALDAAGLKHVYEEYEGMPDVPAGHRQLAATRLREVIKFHSRHLTRPPGPPSHRP